MNAGSQKAVVASSASNVDSAGWRPRGPCIAGGVLVFLAVAMQAPIFDRSIVALDEGYLADVAQRMLMGDVLYSDVQTGIFPGIYYLTCALFRLFGSDLLVLRIAQVVVNTAIVLLLWRVGTRVMGRRSSLLAAVAFLPLIAASFPTFTMLNYSSVALVLGLASLLALLRYLELARWIDGFILGCLVALCVLVKQNFGGLTLLATGVGLLLGRRDSLLSGRRIGRVILPVVTGGIVPAALAAVLLVGSGSFGDFLENTIFAMADSQMEHFNNPIPPIFGDHPSDDPRFDNIYTPPILLNYQFHERWEITDPIRSIAIRASYAVPLATLALAPLLLFGLRKRTPEFRRASLAVVTFAMIFFLGIFPSAIWSHLAFVAPPVLLLGGMLAARADDVIATYSVRAARLTRAVAMLFVVSMLIIAARTVLDISSWFPQPTGVPHATLRVAPFQATILRGAVQFIDECAGSDEFILAIPDIPHMYFITGKRNPSPFDLFIPGPVDAREAIRRLETTRTRCMIFNPHPYPDFPPFEEQFPELALYLLNKFEKRTVIHGFIGHWEGWVRRDDA